MESLGAGSCASAGRAHSRAAASRGKRHMETSSPSARILLGCSWEQAGLLHGDETFQLGIGANEVLGRRRLLLAQEMPQHQCVRQRLAAKLVVLHADKLLGLRLNPAHNSAIFAIWSGR